MKPFNAVVIGTGFIGPVHVEALQRAGVHVTGIVGSTPEKSNLTAEKLGLSTTFATLDDVLRDDSIDAVHLTTPNRFHFEQASAVLRSGKHVLCEKPLAMNGSESAALVRLARETERAAGVAYNIRFYPLCHEASQRVRAIPTNDLFHVTGSYVQDWLLYETDFNWRVMADEGGELRAVADIGTHWLDLIQYVTGQKVVAVCADLRTVHPVRQRPDGGAETFSGASGSSLQSTSPIAIDTEDCGCVMLRFESGANGSLWVSQATAGRKNCLRFEIATAFISVAWNSEAPNALWIGHRDQPNESLIRDPALLGSDARSISNYPGGHNEGFPDTFKQLFRCFYRDIADGSYVTNPSFPTFQDGHREILLCEAILRSHRSRGWVDVDEIDPT